MPIVAPPWLDPDTTAPAGTHYRTFHSAVIGLLDRLAIAHEFSVVPGVGRNRVDVINARCVGVFSFYAKAFAGTQAAKAGL